MTDSKTMINPPIPRPTTRTLADQLAALTAAVEALSDRVDVFEAHRTSVRELQARYDQASEAFPEGCDEGKERWRRFSHEFVSKAPHELVLTIAVLPRYVDGRCYGAGMPSGGRRYVLDHILSHLQQMEWIASAFYLDGAVYLESPCVGDQPAPIRTDIISSGDLARKIDAQVQAEIM